MKPREHVLAVIALLRRVKRHLGEARTSLGRQIVAMKSNALSKEASDESR
jgi:hypothetical protein